MKAIVLQHVAYEGPAGLAPLLAEHGYELELRPLQLGAEIPKRLASGELLVVMGGPMGVGDLDNAEFPFLRRELALLKDCIARDCPVLGVCLGAQLLAHAAGAAVYPMRDHPSGERRYEVGWGPLDFHLSASEPALAGLPAHATVLHLHGDTFDLPKGARLLGSSALCKQQAFRLGRQLGLQFHCEMQPEHVAAFLENGADFVRTANGPGGPEQLLLDSGRYAQPIAELCRRLLGNALAAP